MSDQDRLDRMEATLNLIVWWVAVFMLVAGFALVIAVT